MINAINENSGMWVCCNNGVAIPVNQYESVGIKQKQFCEITIENFKEEIILENQ